MASFKVVIDQHELLLLKQDVKNVLSVSGKLQLTWQIFPTNYMLDLMHLFIEAWDNRSDKKSRGALSGRPL